jgi:uncharacterized protein (DUF2164 family)
MADIELTREDKARLREMLQGYFRDELDQELGRFEAEFLLDYLCRMLGPHFYNQGLLDARVVMEKQMEQVTDMLYQLEKQPSSER